MRFYFHMLYQNLEKSKTMFENEDNAIFFLNGIEINFSDKLNYLRPWAMQVT